VAHAAAPLDELLPSVEAVVVDGLLKLDRLQEELLARIAATWPTTAILPLQTDPAQPSGVDRAARRVLRTYRELGFEVRRVGEAAAATPRQRVLQGLYRHPKQAPSLDDVDAGDLGLRLIEPETVTDEVRAVAGAINHHRRTEPADESIGVVLTDVDRYAPIVGEVLDEVGIPHTLRVDTPLGGTAYGEAIACITGLASPPRTIDTVLTLVSNPLVTDAVILDHLDVQRLTDVASRVSSTRLAATRRHLDRGSDGAIAILLDEVESLATATLATLPRQLKRIMTELGVTGMLQRDDALSDRLRLRERDAMEAVDEVLRTLAQTHPVTDYDRGGALPRLERALEGVSVRPRGRVATGGVVVCTLEEAPQHDFDRVYVLGLTATHFPSDPAPLAFTAPVYERVDELFPQQRAAEATYHLGTLLAGDAPAVLSVPQRTTDGDPLVAAGVIGELGRLVELPEGPAPRSRPDSAEELQEALGELLAQTDVGRVASAVDEAEAAGTFGAAQAERIRAGMACGAARAAPVLTPYDGQLSAETVARLEGARAGGPLSASRVETYAACGFKYHMRYGLQIKAPDPLSTDPDSSARGRYIHRVLDGYYRALVSEHGGAAHPAGEAGAREERLLTVALEQVTEVFGSHDGSAFHAEWLRRVLAGLGDPDRNEHHGSPGERGLLARFLEHEATVLSGATARPRWTEASVGRPADGGVVIQDDPAEVVTPAGPVALHGLIDRVDVVPGTEPTQLVVRDYKTGAVPSERDTLLGLRFQLPLYALLAEEALEDVEVVGGAYYQVRPPGQVSSRRGQLTSGEMVEWKDAEGVQTPLLRDRRPAFETHAAFRRFLEVTMPERLGEVAGGIAAGRFHPTVLDPRDAGCSYCDYRHVCDVRHHLRHALIDGIRGEASPAYIPPVAEGHDVESVLEVE